MDQATDVALRRTPLPNVLADRLRDVRMPSEPIGVVVVSGRVTERALRDWLANHGFPQDAIAITTIEELSQNLLRAAGEHDTVAERPWLYAIVERALSESDWETSTDEALTSLQEYLRATDAGTDHDRLVGHLDELDNRPFDARVSKHQLDYLDQLATAVEDAAPAEWHPTRPHLVSAARSIVPEAWMEIYPSAEWVSFATISRLDNPTLRFLCTMAREQNVPPIMFHAGGGTATQFTTRLHRASDDYTFIFEDDETSPDQNHLDLAEQLTGTLNVRKVTVPDTRREAAYVLHRASDLESLGYSNEVLAVTPDAGDYRTDAIDFAHRYDIPVDVETRFPLADQAITRSIRGLLTLLGSNGPVSFEKVVHPLRVGGLVETSKPISDSELVAFRDSLTSTRPRPVHEWVGKLDKSENEHIAQYADHLSTLRSGTPRDIGHEWFVSLIEGFPEVSTVPTSTRQAVLADSEPSERTKAELVQAVKTAWDSAAEIDGLTSWTTIANLFIQAVAGGGGGRTVNDDSAVRFVDAGNVYFRQSPEVVVMGLSEERFPSDSSPAGCFPRAFAEAVRQSDDPYLALDTRDAIVARAQDQFEAALRCAEERVILLRPGRDVDGRRLPESRFVRDDTLSVDSTSQVSADQHPVEGLSEVPIWRRRVPDTHEQRLRTIALYCSPTNTGQRIPDSSPDIAARDERLADIAATLPQTAIKQAEVATNQFESVRRSFEAARADWDAETVINLPPNWLSENRDRSGMADLLDGQQSWPGAESD